MVYERFKGYCDKELSVLITEEKEDLISDLFDLVEDYKEERCTTKRKKIHKKLCNMIIKNPWVLIIATRYDGMEIVDDTDRNSMYSTNMISMEYVCIPKHGVTIKGYTTDNVSRVLAKKFIDYLSYGCILCPYTMFI